MNGYHTYLEESQKNFSLSEGKQQQHKKRCLLKQLHVNDYK